MSTSGSIDFQLVTNQIIEEAFDICGVGSEGEAISADMYARAKRSLNLIAKAWSANDHLWLQTERSVTLIASTSTYDLVPKPMRVIEVRRVITSSGIETPLTEWSFDEYISQSNKVSDSIPTAFYYDPQRSTGTLYLWPRPSAQAAAQMSLKLTYNRTIEDFDNSNDDPDLPQEWLQALSYALAEQLALKYQVRPDLRQEITARAAQYKADLEAFDTEPASLYLQPAGMWRRG